MDEELNAEIIRLAGEAETIKPHIADLHDLAVRLHALYPHRSEENILERLKGEWRNRGLFWKKM